MLACFILSIDDSMEAILDWIRREGIIFRGGSGFGLNLSRPGSSKEQLKGGAVRAGLVHARRGRLRRDDQVGRQDSPRGEDGRARRRPPGRRGVHLVQGQGGAQGASSSRPATTCRSTRRLGVDPVPERQQSLGPRHGRLHGGRHGGQGVGADRAHRRHGRRDGRGAEAPQGHGRGRVECADPGVQYDTTINAWHTSPNTGRINASNPCSEYMHIDDSACNLASLNLMKFRREDGEFDVEMFEHAVDVVFLAQEIAARPTRPPRSAGTRSASASSASARTSARCSWRAACRTTRTRGARTPRRSPR